LRHPKKRQSVRLLFDPIFAPTGSKLLILTLSIKISDSDDEEPAPKKKPEAKPKKPVQERFVECDSHVFHRKTS
jgi:hypothetical protein